jgi:phosphoglucomutase
VLTGFKWIAEIIRNNEGQKTFIGGGEESYGYMVGEFVRDKDAVVSSCIFAECAAWAADRGMSLYELLIELYLEYGLFKEKLVNVVRKGISGQQEIKAMMENYRSSPPKEIAGSPVVEIRDYLLQKTLVVPSGAEGRLNLPKSDVLQFFLADGSKISVRPSGTEPKIKFYFSIKAELKSKANFRTVDAQLEKKVEEIIGAMGL